MNKVYRIVWNTTSNTWVVAPEFAKGRTKGGKDARKSKNARTSPAAAGAIAAAALAGMVGAAAWSPVALAADADYFKAKGASDASDAAQANGTTSVAIGSNAVAGGVSSMAIGVGAKASGLRSIAQGTGALAGGQDGVALGTSASAGGESSLALGKSANAVTTNAVALGNSATATGGANGVAIGYQSSSGGDSSVALGNGATAKDASTIAVGNGAQALNSNGMALGTSAKATLSNGMALGNGAQSTAVNAMALGTNASAANTSSTALGTSANASGDYAMALGSNSSATGTAGVALGLNAKAVQQGVAVGSSANAAGVSSIALGLSSNAANTNGIAIGTSSQAVKGTSTAIGASSKADAGSTSGASSATAVGANANATGDGAAALGDSAKATSDKATAVGRSANASGTNATALGASANASGNYSMALGAAADAGARNVGSAANASGAYSMALGSGASGGGSFSTAIGNGASGGGSYSLAVGYGASGGGMNSAAFGLGSSAGGQDSLALGEYAGAGGLRSIAIGYGAASGNNAGGGQDSLAIGNRASGGGQDSIALGRVSSAGGQNSIAIGGGTPGTGNDGSSSYSGASAAGQDSIAVGRAAHAGGQNSIAIGGSGSGQDATLGLASWASGEDGIALGRGAQSSDTRNIALGALSHAGFADGSANAPISTAGNTINGKYYSYAGGTADSTVSVGNSLTKLYRTVTNVAAGRVSATSTDAINGSQLYAAYQAFGATVGGDDGSGNDVANAVMYNDTSHSSVTLGGVGATTPVNLTNVAQGALSATSTDAVNGAQLYATNQQVGENTTNITNLGNTVNNLGDSVATLADTPITFAGNSGSVAKKLGETLSIQGAATTAGSYSGANLQTQVDGNGNLQLQMADNLAVTSVTAGNTVINNNGLTIIGGPSVTVDGINAGGQKISNVASGTADTDAATVGQVNAAAAAALNGAVKYDDSTYKSVTLGGTASTDGGVTGGTKITNVAQGALSATSTDAVNGAQLYATNQNVADITNTVNNINNGAGIKYFHANSTGADSSATGNDAIAVGPNASAAGNSAIAMGNGAQATTGSGKAIAIGTNAVANSGISIGESSNTAASQQIAIGPGSSVSSTGGAGVVLGALSSVTGNSGVAIGYLTQANGSQSIAMGTGAGTGSGATTAIAMGYRAGASGASSVALGPYASTTADAQFGTALGNYASVSALGGVAVGSGAVASQDNSVAIGRQSTTTADLTQAAYNPNAAATIAGVTPFGEFSVGATDKERRITNVAAGAAATDAVNVSQLQAAVGMSSADAVKYDDATHTSVTLGDTVSTDGGVTGGVKITNVAQGELSATSTDAVNGAQLYATNQQVGENTTNITNLGNTVNNLGDSVTALADTPITFAGNSGSVAKKLGETMSIQGAATTAGSYSGANLQTQVDGNGNLQLQMADNLAVTSVTAGNTVINNNGLTINGGPSVTVDGIDAGGQKISNVVAGTDDSDAATVGQVNAVAAGATADAVKYDDATHTSVTLGDTASTDGGVTGGVKVTNVAQGELSATSTDAVNGAQLYATNQQVGENTTNITNLGNTINNLGDSVTTLADTPITFAGNSGSVAKKLGDTLSIQGAATTAGDYSGANLKTVVDGNGNLQLQMADNLAVTSVTAGNTVINNNGLTINGGPSVTVDGIDAGGQKISNVASGTADTDAATVGQVNAVAAGAAADAVKYDDASHTSVTLGGVGSTTAVKLTNVAKGTDDTDAVNVSQLKDTGLIDSNGNTLNAVTYDDATKGSITLGGTAYDSATGAGGTKLSNVAGGTGDSDAVNIAQLKGVASGLGGGAGVNADGTITAPEYVVDKNSDGTGGTTYNNVGDAITNIDDRTTQNTTNITNLGNTVNNLGDSVTALADTPITFAGNSGSVAKKLGETMSIQGAATTAGSYSGANLQTQVDGNGNLQLQMADNLAVTSVTAGNTVINNNGLTINGGPSVTVDGIDAGGQKISNVVAGTDDSDAATVGQVNAVAAGAAADAVKYDDASHTSVTLGGVGSTTAVKLTNVAKGTDDTDAVNVSQLKDTGLIDSNGNTLNAVTYDDATKGSITLGGTAYDSATGAGGTKLSNVAGGTGDSDAVNIAQLKGVASGLGGGAGVNADGTITAPEYVVDKNSDGTGGTTYNNVGDAITNIDDRTTQNTTNITNLGNTVNNLGDSVTTLADTPITFAGNSGSVAKKLGETLSIQGAATTAGDYSGANLKTVVDSNGNLQLQMADNLAVTSVTAGNTVVNNNGLTIIGGPSVTVDGIDAGGQKISNVASGTADTDAATVGQVNAVAAGAAADAVKYDDASHTSVTLGGVGSTTAVKLTNVAKGTDDSDAVNVSQLKDSGLIDSNGNTQKAVLFNGPNGEANVAGQKIVNVAKGTDDTDAVNVSQLKDTGLIDSNGNTLNAVTYDDATKGSITLGGTAYDSATGTGGTTISNVAKGTGDSDAVNVAQLKDAGLIDGNGNTQKAVLFNGPNGEANVAGQKIVNVAAGTDDTDAVNVSQLRNAGLVDGNGNTLDAVTYDANTSKGRITLGGTAYDSTTGTGGTTISNVAKGTGDSDAVNVAQLKDAGLIDGNGNTQKAVLFNGPNGEANVAGQKIVNVAKGTDDTDAVNVSQLKDAGLVDGNGNTLNAVTYEDATRSSIALGGAVSTDGGVTGGTRLTNVAQGQLSATSTDAVNGAQLYATNQQVGDNTTNINNLLSGTAGLVQQSGPGANLTVGKDTDGAAVDFADKDGQARVLKNVADGTDDTDAVNVSQLRNAGLLDGSGNTLNAVTYDSASKGSITLGGLGATTSVKLTNVANGTIGAGSLDAVNGGQIATLVDQISGLGSQITEIDNRVTKIEADGTGTGSSLPYVDGNANGSSSNNANAGTSAGVAVGYNATATGENASVLGQNATALGSYGTAIGNDSYAAGPNDTALGGNATVHADGSVAVGANASVTSASATNAVAVGADTQVSAASGTAIGQGASVAAAATGAVALGQGSVAERANTVSVGNSTSQRQITNVAAGTQSTDAVNVSQLTSVVSGLGGGASVDSTTGAVTGPSYQLSNATYSNVGDALSGLDERVNAADHAITEVARGAYSGIAAATALTMIPDVDKDKTLSVGIGTGTYKGYQAVALGGVARITQNIKVKAGFGYSSNGTTAGVGASYQW